MTPFEYLTFAAFFFAGTAVAVIAMRQLIALRDGDPEAL